MYSVMYFDEACWDDLIVFVGSLDDCRTYVDGDDELFIVAPDGFTVVD